jgi:hypothetical protein
MKAETKQTVFGILSIDAPHAYAHNIHTKLMITAIPLGGSSGKAARERKWSGCGISAVPEYFTVHEISPETRPRKKAATKGDFYQKFNLYFCPDNNVR